MPHYTPWTWSAAHGRHYIHYLSDDGRVLETIWSGSSASTTPTSAAPGLRPLTQTQSSHSASLQTYPQTYSTTPSTATYGSGSEHTLGVSSRYAATTKPDGATARVSGAFLSAGTGKTGDSEDEEEDKGGVRQLGRPAHYKEDQCESMAHGASIREGRSWDASIGWAAVSSSLAQDLHGAEEEPRPSNVLDPPHQMMQSLSIGASSSVLSSQPSIPWSNSLPRGSQMRNTESSTSSHPTASRLAPDVGSLPQHTVASLPADVQAHIAYLERRCIQTNEHASEVEPLDPRYRRIARGVQHLFFVPGRVFKMLWTEPAGIANPGRTRNSTHFSTVWCGEQAYSEIRRYVVVWNKGTFSQCVPVHTYRGRGATKPGVVMHDHGVIHTSMTAPNLLPGEHLTKYSIRVSPTNPEDKLEPESRVNYGKCYVVEHNVKVYDIGMIVENHRYLVEAYFDAAMRGQ